MILRVPVTGTLISYDPKTMVGVGSDDDPVRPLDFSKLLPEECKFRWDMLSYDYEGGMAIIEVTFTKNTIITEWDETKDPPEPLAWKRESDAEFYKRQADTERLLWDVFQEKPAAELYKITGEPGLKMPQEK